MIAAFQTFTSVIDCCCLSLNNNSHSIKLDNRASKQTTKDQGIKDASVSHKAVVCAVCDECAQTNTRGRRGVEEDAK